MHSDDETKRPEADTASAGVVASERADRHAAERLCAGCREHGAREDLVRFAIHVEDGVAMLVPDVTRKLGGRGVSVHPTAKCLALAVDRGGFARAASARIDTDAKALGAMLAAQLEQRARGLVQAAIRGRHATLGDDTTQKALAERRVVSVVLASDAAARTAELSETLGRLTVGRLGGHAHVLGTKAELGKLVGRDELAVVGITDEGIAAALAHVVEQLRGVSGTTGQAATGNERSTSGGRSHSRSEAG